MTDQPLQLGLDRVEITLALARPLGYLSAGLYLPGNMRGVMAAGLAGEVRVRAGRAVEEELLAQRPFSLGNAYRTGAGKLAATGLSALAHGIATTEPGETPRTVDSERALRSALALFDEFGIRTATLPMVEIESGVAETRRQGRAMGALLAGHLRRGSRLRQLTIAGLDASFLAGFREALVDAGALLVED